MNNRNHLILITILLAFALSSTLIFIFFSELSDGIEESQEAHFINGTIEGYNQAHIDIFEVVSLCQQFPVTVANLSYNLIAMECLNLSEGGR